jgi:hypothetical protein
MAVRLQTAEGKIKKYETVYSVGGGGDGPPDKYLTKCGKEWKRAPKPHDECDHLDCAIYLAEKQRDEGPKGFVLCIALAAGIMVLEKYGQDFGFALMISGLVALVAFGS